MKRSFCYFVIFVFASFLAISIHAATISGTVIDQETGEGLANAEVIAGGAKVKTADDGSFTIENVSDGSVQLEIQRVGYSTHTSTIDVADDTSIEIKLSSAAIELEAVTVIAGRATVRETPVAFTNVDKKDLGMRLGSRDIPLSLNTTPGIYATNQGGGAGDARINIRGFNQRNVAVMINGVPVNDMENGWVYWSNWDGLGDVTSSIQVQRGLGASKLAISSVGGTLNIITDPANFDRGFSNKFEIGSGNFLKNTLILNSGLIHDSLATSFGIVRKVGDGQVEKTWTNAYAYYGAISYKLNEKNKFELFVIGAPQRHGHRLYKEGIHQFDLETAQNEGINSKADDVFGSEDSNTLYNSNWGPISQKTDEYFALWTTSGNTVTRDQDYLMERENFYHKPQINFNWTGKLTDQLTINNVAYFSRGIGGGTGSYGDGLYKYGVDENGNINFDKVYAINSGAVDLKSNPKTAGESKTIIRNSVNQHFWIGDILSANYKISKDLNLLAGVDLRTYTGEHWREVRNLIGGSYFVNKSDKNSSDPNKKLGDKIAYHNDGKVGWIGGFAQIEGKVDQLTATASFSVSNTSYQRIDYFMKKVDGDWNTSEKVNILGYTAKAGANYNINDQLNAYGNVGYLSKAPNFDSVIHYDNSLYDDITNEKVIAIEAGVGYTSSILAANVNVYNTSWIDRTWPTSTSIGEDDARVTYRYLLHGLNATHRGVELDLKARPIEDLLDVGAMVSLGDYAWGNNVEATYSPDDLAIPPQTTMLYTDGLKVGNAPMVTTSVYGTVRPIDGAYLNLTIKGFAEHYAEFNPANRTDEKDREQSYKLPNYSLIDLHGGYALPIDLNGLRISIGLHVFNLLDAKYIADADDNDKYSAVNSKSLNHDAASAGVFFGLPRRFNASVTVEF